MHHAKELSKGWQSYTPPIDQLTGHFNLKSNHRSNNSCEGKQSKRHFIFISLVSGGLSASWTERAGEEAGNVADCKTFLGYQVKVKSSIRAATEELLRCCLNVSDKEK